MRSRVETAVCILYVLQYSVRTRKHARCSYASEWYMFVRSVCIEPALLVNTNVECAIEIWTVVSTLLRIHAQPERH